MLKRARGTIPLPTNQIIQGDCVEIMSHLPDASIDLVVTSPPYDNLRKYNGYSFDFENVAAELHRIVKDGGVIVWVVGDQTINGSESGTSFRQALYFKKIGFNIHDTMIFKKQNYAPLNHSRYEQEFEYIFVFSRGKPKTFNPIRVACVNFGETRNSKYSKHGERMKRVRSEAKRESIKPTKIRGNIFEYKVGYGHSTTDNQAFQHPATFPEQLAADQIKSWSNPHDVVLDPFNGSGTTTKMSQYLNRNYIGIEISPEYCKIAKQRLSQKALLLAA